MRIGIISNYYPPNERGGAEVVAKRVADELAKRGHEIFVLTNGTYPSFPFNFENNASTPFPLKLIWHVIDLFNPFSKSVIRRFLATKKPDVVLTHNLKGIGLNISRLIQEQGVFQIHTLHDLQLSVPSGLLIHGEEESFLNRSKWRMWYEHAAKKAIGKPNVIISPSKFLADYYRTRGFFTDQEILVLPNPKPEIYIPDREADRGGLMRFLFAGQLEPHKGISVLLEAIKNLPPTLMKGGAGGGTFELHVVGRGSMSDLVSARASQDPRIIPHGFISLPQLVHLLSKTDATIVPSLCYENSPTIIYESFASGVPVIASRIGGIPELVIEGESGLLIEAGDVGALSNAMKKMADDRDLFWNKAAIIRKEAQKYALAGYVDRIEEIIKTKITA